jgi:hypothetical protein
MFVQHNIVAHSRDIYTSLAIHTAQYHFTQSAFIVI